MARASHRSSWRRGDFYRRAIARYGHSDFYRFFKNEFLIAVGVTQAQGVDPLNAERGFIDTDHATAGAVVAANIHPARTSWKKALFSAIGYSSHWFLLIDWTGKRLALPSISACTGKAIIDPNRLVLSLVVLLGNAAKYTEAGKINLSARVEN